jgi:hypothetical protein
VFSSSSWPAPVATATASSVVDTDNPTTLSSGGRCWKGLLLLLLLLPHWLAWAWLLGVCWSL